jgi:energy-coupling factor transporter ATP-binding protein EcfA2
VDEPTSGLSSQDSEMVMNLLKRLTYKGQLIFCVIHQPSSHIYKLLDRLLLLDKGGYLIFNNHPMEAPGWFRKRACFVESPTTIGKGVAVVDPDEMLRIVEARQVDEFGRTTNERVRTPKEWYEAFMAQVKPIENQTGQTSVYTPPRPYLTPSWATQFGIYFKRNLLSKIRNRAYLAIALLEAPVLASIIGYFTRYAAGNEDDPFAYFLYFNKNLPAYLFMIIVVAIFIGMQISAEEIIRDRKILRRESFLNLKRSAYINSKVLYFLFLSAIQAGLLTLAGNLWLQIEGLYMLFFTVLFSTFVFANLLGLNISASLKSVVTIYILVPFLVVPQLLLSGVIVDFDTLQSADKQGGPTPVIADIMVSRWAYEALAVGHFTQNKYMKHFFDAEREKQEALYQFSLRIPKLQTINQQSTALIGRNDASGELSEKLNLLNHEVQKINNEMNPRFEHNKSLRVDSYNQLTADLLDAWLREMERQYRKIWEKADDVLRQREDLLVSEENSITDISEWKNRHHNEKLEEHVRNKHELQKLRVVDGKLIRKTDYIYLLPESHFGRAHFYAPVKKTGEFFLSTHWFNVAVIWLMNVLLYIILLNNRGGSFLKKPAFFKRS